MEPTIGELRRWSAELAGQDFMVRHDNQVWSYTLNCLWLPDNPKTGQIWLVVERMIKMGYTFALYRFIGPPVWIAKFMKIDEWRNEGVDHCLAILKAAHAAEGAKK